MGELELDTSQEHRARPCPLAQAKNPRVSLRDVSARVVVCVDTHCTQSPIRPNQAECPQGKPEGLLVGHREGQLAHHLPLRGRGRPRRGPDRLPLMRGGAGRPPDIGGMRSAGRGRAGLIRKLTPPANGPAGLQAVPARLRRAIADRARPAARRLPERAQPRSVLAPVRGAPEALHGPDGVFRVQHHDRHPPVGGGDPGHAGPGTVRIGGMPLGRTSNPTPPKNTEPDPAHSRRPRTLASLFAM